MDEVSAANFVAGRGIEGVLDGRNRPVVPWSAKQRVAEIGR
jgi:hypothetical protein